MAYIFQMTISNIFLFQKNKNFHLKNSRLNFSIRFLITHFYCSSSEVALQYLGWQQPKTAALLFVFPPTDKNTIPHNRFEKQTKESADNFEVRRDTDKIFT